MPVQEAVTPAQTKCRLTYSDSNSWCVAVAAARVVWYLARNPTVAMELMRCNLVPVLYHGLAKQDVSDQLPLIGGLFLVSRGFFAVTEIVANLVPVQ